MQAEARKPLIIRRKQPSATEYMRTSSQMDDRAEGSMAMNEIMLSDSQGIEKPDDEAILLLPEQEFVQSNEEEGLYEEIIDPEPSTSSAGNVPSGVANDVEAYPCKYCEHRLFLTGEGLLRHAKEVHPDHLVDIIFHIETIASEWRRRERELERYRERAMVARYRQEEVTRAALRQAKLGRMTGSTKPITFSAGDKFESCCMCGLLVNQKHPTAMENHMRAHKKNDELRKRMVREYGPEIVQRLSCPDCRLVFTDEFKLRHHTESMHLKKRKYVCKWCGHICQSVSELNTHKADMHGVNLFRGSSTMTKPLLHSAAPLGLRNPALSMQYFGTAGARPPTSICKTVCQVCGLSMVRPSLLIRHMLRVHNKAQYQATIQFRDSIPYNVNVNGGQLTWICCQQEFNDRDAFSMHRRATHPPTFAPMPIEQPDEQEAAGSNMHYEPNDGTVQGELVPGPDGSMQVIVSDAMDINQVYTLVMLDDGQGADSGKKNVLLRTANMYDETDDGVGDDANEFFEAAEQHEDDGLVKNEPGLEELGDDVITFSEMEWNELQEQYAGNVPPLLIKRDNGDMIPARVVVVRTEPR
ncbi:unnamed protein product, partial [Mesorhabditis spiculigera]